MSLFSAREWWSTQLADDEGFSEGALLVANIDNSLDNKDKIVIGSFSGLLRIFSISGGGETLSGYQASDLLLETDLKYPILQVAGGQFLSASDKLHLAVLHPRKLSIFSVSGTAGFSEHGSSYNILLIYEHNLQRSSFNMVTGRFGQVKGRDFFCIQSLDGTLSFYEQESFAFSRFLPNFLTPGPIAYIATTDSFLVSTGNWSMESYRYQVLAISKDSGGESGADDNVATTGRGRRVSPDWSVVIGEAVLDIDVIQIEKKSTAIVILGERSILVLKENGSTLFSKKLDYSPSCMTSYLNQEQLMVAVCTEHKSILVYSSEALKWAAQLPMSPIAVKRATIATIQGSLIFLSDNGFLSCNYLGTAPSLNVVTVNNSEYGITNYAEAEVELQELKKIISAFNADSNNLTGASLTTAKSSRSTQAVADIELKVSEPIIVRAENMVVRRQQQTETNQRMRPIVAYTLQLEAMTTVTNVRLMVQVPKPLSIDNNVYTYATMAAHSEVKQSQVMVVLEDQHLPPNLKMHLLIAYANSSGSPRVHQRELTLPLYLLARLSPPSKETEHTISLDVVCHASLNLTDIFADLVSASDRPLTDESLTSIGINFYDDITASVTVSVSVRPPKQKFRLKSDSFNGLSFISCELIRRLQCRNVKFDTAVLDKNSLPLEAFLRIIDDHLMARQLLLEKQDQLAKYATQYRTIEKRFLVKLKDRNPTPLNDLDLLLDCVHSKITILGEELIELVNDIKRKTSALSSATDLILKIVSIGTNMKQEQMNTLRASMSPHITADIEEGWQERTEIALINLLANHLKEINDIAKYSQNSLIIPTNYNKLRDLIIKLVDKTYSGEVLSVKSNSTHQSNQATSEANETSLMKQSNFVAPSNEIIPEEDEINDDDNSLNLNSKPSFLDNS